jgi:hypothetical protein
MSKRRGSSIKQIRRQWLTTLRVEHRYGQTRYVAAFSDGHIRATLCGSLGPLAHELSEVRQAGWQVALDWLEHVQPTTRRSKRDYRRIYFPINRERRKHHGGFRRVAA